MNSLTSNIVRSILNQARKYTSPRIISPYSTATSTIDETPIQSSETSDESDKPQVTCEVQSSQTTDEPDKLYKTIEIEMRAHEPATLKSYSAFLSMTAKHLDIPVGKCWTPVKPRYDREGLTILRSRFVHKKHRTQYEVRTYFRFMNFHHLTGSTADTFLEYIERNLPEGVALKVTKVALEKLPPEVYTPPVFDEETPEEEDKGEEKEQKVQEQ